MSIDQSLAARSYQNICLSYRGSERQPPSTLALALMFSSIMSEKSQTGVHDKSMTTEARLKSVVWEYHDQPGVLSKYRIDQDKEKAILNLLQGTTATTRSLIQTHLHYHRWKESCFTSDLLKSNRCLVSACPRSCKDFMKVILTVTGEIQEAFISNVIGMFVFQTAKVKVSTRAKYRPSQSEWDRVVDYVAVMTRVKLEAQETLGDDPEKCASVIQSIETLMSNRLD